MEIREWRCSGPSCVWVFLEPDEWDKGYFRGAVQPSKNPRSTSWCFPIESVDFLRPHVAKQKRLIVRGQAKPRTVIAG